MLYAIRAQGGGHKKPGHTQTAAIPVGEAPEAMATEDLTFGGDSLACEFDGQGRVARCQVGCQSTKDAPQTPDSYDAAVEAKIPEGYLEPLRAAMRDLLKTYAKRELQGALLYQVYDDWKLACKAGRRVDLDNLLAWLTERARQRAAG